MRETHLKMSSVDALNCKRESTYVPVRLSSLWPALERPALEVLRAAADSLGRFAKLRDIENIRRLVCDVFSIGRKSNVSVEISVLDARDLLGIIGVQTYRIPVKLIRIIGNGAIFDTVRGWWVSIDLMKSSKRQRRRQKEWSVVTAGTWDLYGTTSILLRPPAPSVR